MFLSLLGCVPIVIWDHHIVGIASQRYGRPSQPGLRLSRASWEDGPLQCRTSPNEYEAQNLPQLWSIQNHALPLGDTRSFIWACDRCLVPRAHSTTTKFLHRR